jgi:tRNA G37 N-methylase TrmD
MFFALLTVSSPLFFSGGIHRKYKIMTSALATSVDSHIRTDSLFVDSYKKGGKKWIVPKVLLSGDHKKIKEWREGTQN